MLATIGTAAHLAGSLVLATFFVLLARQTARGYFRDWTAAWIAQAAALGLLLLSEALGWTASLSAYLFLAASHGVLLCAAAQNESRGLGLRREHSFVLLPVALWSGVAPQLLDDTWALRSGLNAILAITYALAAVLLWPHVRRPGTGMRVVVWSLLALAALFAQYAAVLFWAASHERERLLYAELEPFATLVVQMLLGLGMVLATMEEGQQQLREAKAQVEDRNERLRALADTDTLTGCFNRRVFRRLVSDLRAGDGAADRGLVLVIDMDGLKRINDEQGHAAGDAAIRRLADAVRDHVRNDDLFVRWGGDEFVVVLPGAGAHEGPGRRSALHEALAAADCRASIGFAPWGPGTDILAAVDAADLAMYAEKDEHRRAAAAEAAR
jgi:diguanylate cyclase (GGDEF)-like protein